MVAKDGEDARSRRPTSVPSLPWMDSCPSHDAGGASFPRRGHFGRRASGPSRRDDATSRDAVDAMPSAQANKGTRDHGPRPCVEGTGQRGWSSESIPSALARTFDATAQVLRGPFQDGGQRKCQCERACYFYEGYIKRLFSYPLDLQASLWDAIEKFRDQRDDFRTIARK